jgi:hypothetical protein
VVLVVDGKCIAQFAVDSTDENETPNNATFDISRHENRYGCDLVVQPTSEANEVRTDNGVMYALLVPQGM